MIAYLVAFVFPIFMFGFGIYLIFKGAKRFLMVQRIENTPTSKAQSAAIGLVELHGQMAGEKTLKSPISMTNCIYWAVHAHQFDPFHNNYKLIAMAEACSTFILSDQSGQVEVDPKGAEFELSETNTNSSFLTSLTPDDPKVGAFESTSQMSKRAGDSAMDFIRSGVSGSVVSQDTHYTKNENLRNFIRLNSTFQATLSRFAGRNIRVTEFTLSPAHDVYVIGSLGIGSGAGVKVHMGMEGVLFISDEREPELVKALRFGSLKNLAAGWVLIAASVTIFIVLSQNIL